MTTAMRQLENEKRGSKRRVEKIEEGEKDKAHASEGMRVRLQPCVTCPISSRQKNSAVRPLAITDICKDHRNVHNVRAPQARRGAIVHTVKLDLTRLGVIEDHGRARL
jgi:hypothetical protein